jgi:hypothetical protein
MLTHIPTTKALDNTNIIIQASLSLSLDSLPLNSNIKFMLPHEKRTLTATWRNLETSRIDSHQCSLNADIQGSAELD